MDINWTIFDKEHMLEYGYTYAEGLAQQLYNKNELLKNKIKEQEDRIYILELERTCDYKDLRKFQGKYIESDQELRDIQEKKDILENKIKELENNISTLEDRNANEYIDLAEILMRYKSALFKIAYIKNEWDDPVDFINDLKNIAKETL
jgi:chromosome segregation ATPase